ncbi:MAG: methyltransferase domain-containing protein [Candidatus Limnocylindrales bacterium]|nr:methyltransferase domain-containing protein [Candidatus Limnocylindrales bacterium]
MTDQAARYDRIAEGYARWWAPVLSPAVGRLLDRAAPWLADGAVRVLDIGTGTGQQAFGALDRWPLVSVVGVDASTEMRAMADSFAERTLGATGKRFRTEVAFADALPFPDGTFDLALSSFVLQLVPNRARALREARRVIRTGGVLAYVSWLHDDRAFTPDLIFDEVLESLGIGGREPDGRSGDLPSVERAARELRRAGFAEVAAEPDVLEHRFTVDGYLAFLSEFDEESLFDELDPRLRDRLVATMRKRLTLLSPADLTMQSPIVFASGRRSGR